MESYVENFEENETSITGEKYDFNVFGIECIYNAYNVFYFLKCHATHS